MKLFTQIGITFMFVLAFATFLVMAANDININDIKQVANYQK